MAQPSYTQMLAAADDGALVTAAFQRAIKRGLQLSGGEVLYSDTDENTGDILSTVSFNAGHVRTYRLTLTEETS